MGDEENVLAEKDFMEMLAEGKRSYMVESYKFKVNLAEQYIKVDIE